MPCAEYGNPISQMDTNIEHEYAKKQESSSLPMEFCYADDADHPTLDKT
jgi:hypothetical protein